MEGINTNTNPNIYSTPGTNTDFSPKDVKGTKDVDATNPNLDISNQGRVDGSGIESVIVNGVQIDPPTGEETPEEICEQLTFLLDNIGDDTSVMLIVYELLLLLQEAMRQQRESMQMTRQSEYQISIANIEAQAKTLRDGARDGLILGCISAGLQMASALVTLTGGIKAGAKMGKEMPGINAMEEGDAKNQALANLNKELDILTMKFQGGAGIASSTATAFDAASNFVQGRAQADAKLQEAESTKMEQQAAETGDLIKNMVDFLTQLLDIIKSINQSQHDTNENIIRDI